MDAFLDHQRLSGQTRLDQRLVLHDELMQSYDQLVDALQSQTCVHLFHLQTAAERLQQMLEPALLHEFHSPLQSFLLINSCHQPVHYLQRVQQLVS